MEHGLGSNWVKKVIQDKEGYIWFLTGDGLHRYDGSDFEIYRNDPDNESTLPANNCKTLVADKSNGIWVGHHFGVSRFDPKTKTFLNFKHAANNPASIPSNDVISMSVDKVGNIWVATISDGLAVIDPITYQVQRINDLPGSPIDFKMHDIKAIFCDENELVWVGSSTEGIALLDWKNKKIERFVKPAITINSIVSFYKDAKNKIWIGTLTGGLLEYSHESKVFTRHLETNGRSFIESVHGITEAANGELWLACENYGLVVYNPVTKQHRTIKYSKFQANGLPHQSIQCVFRDVQQNIWVGTFSGGLAFYKYPNNLFGHYFTINEDPKSLSENSVICFLEDSRGNFWVGTDRGGITRYNKDNSMTFIGNHPLAKVKLPSDVVIRMHEDIDHQIWIGSLYKGFQILNPITNAITSYSQITTVDGEEIFEFSASSFLEEPNGDMWIGTWGKGLFYYSKSQKTFKRFLHDKTQNSLGSNFVFYLDRDKSGIIWISTGSGLSRLDPTTKSFRNFVNENKNSKSISGYTIFHTLEDSKGRLWIATDKGLNLYDRASNTFKSYQEPFNFPCNNIFYIQEDSKGYIWCSSSNGLIRFNPKTEDYRVFQKNEGIQSRQFAISCGYKLKNGYLAFGGSEGFNLFDPLKIPETAEPDPFYCYIKQLDKMDRLFQDSLIHLDYESRNFELFFLTLDLNQDKKNSITYKLEGFDTDWKNSQNKGLATYTNLDAGSYTFVVKVFFSQLNKYKEYRFKLEVEAPFWQRWYVLLLGILLASWGLYYLNKLRNRYYVRQKKILEQKIEVRTFEIVKQKEKIENLLLHMEESIDVAQTIQQSLLPSQAKFKEGFQDSFTWYKPLAKVSGDFYWMMKKGDKIYMSLLDCTGHGVPGAILAMMANDKLNELARTRTFNTAAEFMQLLQNEHGETIHSDANVLSGMDIAFCIIDTAKCEIQFSGAKSPIILATSTELKLFKGARFPIGYTDVSNDFENTIIPYEAGDMLYFYTDGVIDQMGGEGASKFLVSRLKTMLGSIRSLTCSEQKAAVESTLSSWMGKNEQLDDMSMIGVRL